MTRRYGWRGPGPTDWNAPRYRSVRPSGVALPDHVDRLSLAIPIRDQADEGCCTGFGTARGIQTATKSAELSPQFLYFNARDVEGTEDSDSGAIISDVFRGITLYGIAGEAVYPYVVGQYAQRPTLDAYADAHDNTPKFTPFKVSTLADIKTALANGHPVVFGFSVPDYFESAQVAQTGLVRLPTTFDNFIGGHCVIADGYDDRSNMPYIWCANSWSPQWGLQGWFQMAQAWFSDPRCLWDDGWAIVRQ